MDEQDRKGDAVADDAPRSTVSIGTEAELEFWCRRLGTDRATLVRGIAAVGTSAADLQAWLLGVPPGHAEER